MVKAAATSMETGSASGLADGATETVMKLQYLKVGSCFLWHSNPSLQ